METKPRITFMGEEMDYDDLPGGGAAGLEDHFKPVRLSPWAIDQVSKIVPREHWMEDGLHTWLKHRAEFVFSKLSASETEGRLRSLIYSFEFDANGPVLKSVMHRPV